MPSAPPPTRLVQITHPEQGRRVALVQGDELALLATYRSIYAFAVAAIETGLALPEILFNDLSGIMLDYNEVHGLRSVWRFLPCFDHPSEPGRCLVSGTGLTHLASAANRNAMHEANTPVTDSMRMYQLGVEGGRPEPGSIGAAPEWFYKGNGTILRGHGEPLGIPPFGGDGGEEAELAAAYVIGPDGTPHRVGMAPANEFSDHRTEKQNYLYLAHSKLRTCAVGPELTLDPDFSLVPGTVSIERRSAPIWEKQISTGDARMCHSLANIEQHHFKYDAHRRPGDAHVHFLGADSFSFGEGVVLEDGDEIVIAFQGFGRALRNPARVEPPPPRKVNVLTL